MNNIIYSPAPKPPLQYSLPAVGKQIRIHAEVVFGSPSKNCDGYGVCVLVSQIYAQQYKCSSYPCLIIYEKKEDLIVLELKKEQVPTLTTIKFLDNRSSFFVEEHYQLPRMLLKEMGLKGAFSILKGNYPIIESKLKWKIQIPLKQIK
jgi:hypothetical protein